MQSQCDEPFFPLSPYCTPRYPTLPDTALPHLTPPHLPCLLHPTPKLLPTLPYSLHYPTLPYYRILPYLICSTLPYLHYQPKIVVPTQPTLLNLIPPTVPYPTLYLALPVPYLHLPTPKLPCLTLHLIWMKQGSVG